MYVWGEVGGGGMCVLGGGTVTPVPSPTKPTARGETSYEWLAFLSLIKLYTPALDCHKLGDRTASSGALSPAISDKIQKNWNVFWPT